MATRKLLGIFFIATCCTSLFADNTVSMNELASAVEHVISDMRDQQTKYDEDLNARDKKISEASATIALMKHQIDELKKTDEAFTQTNKELTKNISEIKEKQRAGEHNPRTSVEIIPISTTNTDAVRGQFKSSNGAVATGCLKIHERPSLNSHVVGHLTEGESVEAVEHINSSEVPNGFSRINRGWVSTKYLNFKANGAKE